MCCPPRSFHWWGWLSVKIAVCPLPSAGGLGGIVMCGYLTLSPGKESLCRGAGPCPGCLHFSRLAALLWVGSSQGHIGGAKSTGKCGNRPMECQEALHQSIAEEHCSCPGLDGGGISVGERWGEANCSLCNQCWPCTGSFRCPFI